MLQNVIQLKKIFFQKSIDKLKLICYNNVVGYRNGYLARLITSELRVQISPLLPIRAFGGNGRHNGLKIHYSEKDVLVQVQ